MNAVQRAARKHVRRLEAKNKAHTEACSAARKRGDPIPKWDASTDFDGDDVIEHIADLDLRAAFTMKPVRQKGVSRASRWEDATGTLRELLREYDKWLEKLPDSIRQGGSTLVSKLEAMTELDSALSDLETADLPIGWGKD
jgi:hypothetical protein